MANTDPQLWDVVTPAIYRSIQALVASGYSEEDILELLETPLPSRNSCIGAVENRPLPAQTAEEPYYGMASRSGTDSSGFVSSAHSSGRYSMQSSMSSRNGSGHESGPSSQMELYRAIRPSNAMAGHYQHHDDWVIPESPVMSQSIASPSSPERAMKSTSQGRSASAQVWMCPWCLTGNARAADLKTHMRQYCGSSKGCICTTCHHVVHTRRQLREHFNTSAKCGRPGFKSSGSDFGYQRYAFSCPTCGKVSTALEDHIQHVVDKRCAHKLEAISNQQRSQQIRELLFTTSISSSVVEHCRNRGIDVNRIRALSWNSCSPTYLTQVVEKLEYGERKVPADKPNLGIPKETVDSFLQDLIGNGIEFCEEPSYDMQHTQMPLLTTSGTSVNPIQGAFYNHGINHHIGMPGAFNTDSLPFNRADISTYGS